MTPTVIGIGVPRGGSTWLHNLLESHPDVAMPRQRKEIHYFDHNYDRGLEWYERYFPPASSASKYKAAGEVTPFYLYSPEAPTRIRALPTVRGVIAILRDPVKRAFSHYIWRIRYDGYRGSFEKFLVDYPDARRWSCYAEGVERYLEVFGRERFLILISESVFNDPRAARQQIAEFVGIDEKRFPEHAGMERINSGQLPRLPWLFRIGSKTSHWLRKHKVDWIPYLLGSRLGLKYWLGAPGKHQPKLTQEMHQRTFSLFEKDITTLERLLDRDLNLWRPHDSGENAESIENTGTAPDQQRRG